MQGTQAKFSFPLDDQFWAVKFIDQFNQAHARTRTASVQVMLQQVRVHSAIELTTLSREATEFFFGRRTGDPQPVFDFVSILAGALPAIRIGDVFRNGEKVGELRSVMHRLTLRPGESDSAQGYAGTTIEPPPGWGENVPYRVLNASEYFGIADHFKRSVRFGESLFTFFRRRRKDGGTDTYVVPRMTIFRAFYASHSVLANAFCSAPWSQEVNRVISFTRTVGGAQTGIVENGRQWDIVLQSLIQDEYAGILAVLHFDDYARARAESIYAKALQTRAANPRAP